MAGNLSGTFTGISLNFSPSQPPQKGGFGKGMFLYLQIQITHWQI
jgi:hypothetical protein